MNYENIDYNNAENLRALIRTITDGAYNAGDTIELSESDILAIECVRNFRD